MRGIKSGIYDGANTDEVHGRRLSAAMSHADPTPYRSAAERPPLNPHLACGNCGAVHLRTWFYGRGYGDSWWGYATWFVREVPAGRVGCSLAHPWNIVEPQPRGLRRWLMMWRGYWGNL